MGVIGDLKRRLSIEEGTKPFPYLDIYNKITIGKGRNLTDIGLSDEEIEILFQNDVIRVINELNSIFSNARTFSEGRQIALLDMLFQLGKTRFLGFKKMISTIRVNNWKDAQIEALDSKWAREFPARAKPLAELLGGEEGK